jgi:hypothetical protein
MEIEILNQIINSGYLTIGITLGAVVLFSWLMVPRFVQQFRQRLLVKNEGIAEKIGAYTVLIRDGEILKKTKGRITREGNLLADNRAWVMEDVKPYFLKDGWNTRPCFIVDARKQIYYRFTNSDNSKQREIAGHASDPQMLKRFIDSTVIQKLTSAKTDKTMLIMVFVMGMFVFFLVQSFIPKGG